jgi:hypothetical protein
VEHAVSVASDVGLFGLGRRDNFAQLAVASEPTGVRSRRGPATPLIYGGLTMEDIWPVVKPLFELSQAGGHVDASVGWTRDGRFINASGPVQWYIDGDHLGLRGHLDQPCAAYPKPFQPMLLQITKAGPANTFAIVTDLSMGGTRTLDAPFASPGYFGAPGTSWVFQSSWPKEVVDIWLVNRWVATHTSEHASFIRAMLDERPSVEKPPRDVIGASSS